MITRWELERWSGRWFWKATINRKKSLCSAQHFVVNKIYKNFQKKVLHLRFAFAIITFARLKGAWNLGNKPFPKKFQKNFKKVVDKDCSTWYSKWVAAIRSNNTAPWQINSNATLKNSKRIIQNKDLVNNGQNEKPSFSSLSDQTFKRESSILAQDERWRRA